MKEILISNNIPYEKGLPFAGHIAHALYDPLLLLRRLSNKFGDIVKISLAGKIIYLVQNPETCRHILQENARNYYKPGAAKEMKRFLGNGLATSNGECWLRQRRLMQPAFHKKKIAALVKIIDDETRFLVDKWNTLALPKKININDEFLGLTLANITKAMFGTDLHNNLDEITRVVNKLLLLATRRATSVVKIPPYIPTPANIQFKKVNKEFEKIIYQIIEQRQKEYHDNKPPGHDDLLDMLINAYDDDSQSYMNASQLRDEITTIFMAGHETTAQTLSWVFYHLAANPLICEKVRVEAGTINGEITLDTLQNLSYTKNIIEETLRLYPPVWVMARKAVAADNIKSITIPANATVLLNVYGMHYNKSHWKYPDNFNPDNFHADNRLHHPFAYLPFGGGQRICIGKQFAMMVMQTVVARLVKEFDFEFTGKKPVVAPGITLRAKGGIELNIKKIA